MSILDALGYIGDTLDKPGRAVRGLFGGRPEELLAAIPFSDSLGLTDKANRVSGQDLTGMDDGSLLSTIGNIGTEVALDPLMFAGAGLGRLLGRNANAAAVARGPGFATTEDDIVRMARGFDSGGTMNKVKSTDAAWDSVTDKVPGGVMGEKRRLNLDKFENAGGVRAEHDAGVGLARVQPEEWARMHELGDDARMLNAFEVEKNTIDAIRRNAVDDLARSSTTGSESTVDWFLQNLSTEKNPADLRRMLSEIDPRSKIIGMGNEAVAFRTPSGQVQRVGLGSVGSPGRPVAEGVLPANSAIDIGNTYRVERTPFAEQVGDSSFFRRRDPSTMRTPVDDVDRALAESNLKLTDRHHGNLGIHNGKPVVIDPGAVDPAFKNPMTDVLSPMVKLFTGQHSPVTQAGDPSRLMNLLLDSVGSNDAVRRAFASGLSGPRLDRKIAGYGAAAGADAGILARLLGGE